jgi:hypothetical protein
MDLPDPGAAADEPTYAAEMVERAAWERFVTALEAVSELQRAWAIGHEDPVAERLRRAEVELEDSIAVAGEFEVKNIRWLLT